MRPVTFLVPDLGHASHAKQVSLLAPAMKTAGHPVNVFSLAGDGTFSTPLRMAGLAVEGHRGRRFFDIGDFLLLRRRLDETREGTLHVFGLSALRAAKLTGIGLDRLEIILTLKGREKLNRINRRWVNQVGRIQVPHAVARDHLIAQEISAALIEVVRPVVALPPPLPDRDEFCRSIGVSPHVPLLMTAGQMRNSDLYVALWVFEYIRYPEKSARLLMMGDGPGREKIESASHGLAPEGSRVMFLGARPDVPNVLGLAEIVILPQKTGGVNVALEAMAAGRAVVATATPDMSAIIRHNETGILVPNGSPYEFARIMYKLMHDPARRDALGKAAAGWVKASQNLP
ncbi:MAG: glycosyltransferase [Gemmataceae bacterium]|nr:glycosyltransferase [Gemmataceae bacterium]